VIDAGEAAAEDCGVEDSSFEVLSVAFHFVVRAVVGVRLLHGWLPCGSRVGQHPLPTTEALRDLAWRPAFSSHLRPTSGLIAAMLLYNIGVVAVLPHARLGLGLSGIALWPAVVLHILLAIWCVVCLRKRPT
jgi:hypothetical protein